MENNEEMQELAPFMFVNVLTINNPISQNDLGQFVIPSELTYTEIAKIAKWFSENKLSEGDSLVPFLMDTGHGKFKCYYVPKEDAPVEALTYYTIGTIAEAFNEHQAVVKRGSLLVNHFIRFIFPLKMAIGHSGLSFTRDDSQKHEAEIRVRLHEWIEGLDDDAFEGVGFGHLLKDGLKIISDYLIENAAISHYPSLMVKEEMLKEMLNIPNSDRDFSNKWIKD